MIKAEIDAVNETCNLDIRGKLGDVSCETQYLVGSLASSIEDVDVRYVFLKDMLKFVVNEMKEIEKNA